MRALRASLGAVTLSLLAAFPRPLAAQGLDLTVNHVGLAIGDVPRVDRAPPQLPRPPSRAGGRDERDHLVAVRATAGRASCGDSRSDFPVTGADRIDGVGDRDLRRRRAASDSAASGSVRRASARNDSRGIMIGGLGVGAGVTSPGSASADSGSAAAARCTACSSAVSARAAAGHHRASSSAGSARERAGT